MYKLNNLRLISASGLKCIWPLPSLNPLKATECLLQLRWKTTGVRLPSQSIVVTNLCEKLKCTEIVAKSIYENCPVLRSIDSIQDDSLQILCQHLSLHSVIENPELITMGLGKWTLNKRFFCIQIMTFKSGFRYIESENWSFERREAKESRWFCSFAPV